MGRIVAVVNQKGGVGKTTSTINLGAALAEEGARVLLVDFDPQGALSVGLGLNPNSIDSTVYNLLLDRSVTFDEVVVTLQDPRPGPDSLEHRPLRGGGDAGQRGCPGAAA